ncbi:MAG: hypothetical protein QOH21_2990 [Acidobacteriota bacterium]|jgi:hypothetical protein|nr:hypothetical protein [Acidobacteriota bacterium]
MSEVSYAYHANALGIGGVIHHPTRKVIPSLAATVLAPTGGMGSSVVTDYNQHGVSFTTAYSMVRGDETSDGHFRTEAEVTIDNLDVQGKLHVDRMRATVTSLRLPTESEARITFHAEYVGFYIGGDKVLPDVDLDLFTNYPTYDQFLGEVAYNWGHYKDLFGWNDQELPDVDLQIQKALSPPSSPVGPNPLTSLRASMLRGVNTDADIERKGNVLRVPGFGKVRLAEVLLKPGRRRLTLLQVDLDRPEPVIQSAMAQIARGVENLLAGDSETSTAQSGGTISMASLEGNGTLIWPKQGG